MPYDTEVIERAWQVDLLPYLQTCESIFRAMSTAPRPTAACRFPMVNGAGSPVKLGVQCAELFH